MKSSIIICITFIFSLMLVIGKEKSETIIFQYLSGEKKISYDSGKNWNTKKNLKVRIIRNDFMKFSLDGGKNWFCDKPITNNNQLVSKDDIIIFKIDKVDDNSPIKGKLTIYDTYRFNKYYENYYTTQEINNLNLVELLNKKGNYIILFEINSIIYKKQLLLD